MKRSAVNQVAPNAADTMASLPKNNGKHKSSDDALDLTVILASLQSMRDGDFTVRLPGTWVGLDQAAGATYKVTCRAVQ